MTDTLPAFPDRHSEAAIAGWLREVVDERRRSAVFTITAPPGFEASAAGADFEILVVPIRGRRTTKFRVMYAEEIDRFAGPTDATATLLAKICARVRNPSARFVRFDDLQEGRG